MSEPLGSNHPAHAVCRLGLETQTWTQETRCVYACLGRPSVYQALRLQRPCIGDNCSRAVFGEQHHRSRAVFGEHFWRTVARGAPPSCVYIILARTCIRIPSHHITSHRIPSHHITSHRIYEEPAIERTARIILHILHHPTSCIIRHCTSCIIHHCTSAIAHPGQIAASTLLLNDPDLNLKNLNEFKPAIMVAMEPCMA